MNGLASMARQLGGEVVGRTSINIPTPGHSLQDRGTTITFDPGAPGGFLVHSRNGGDPLSIKDHVCRVLGLPGFEPGQDAPTGYFPSEGRPAEKISADDRDRTERALALWHEASPILGTPAEGYLASRGLSYKGEALRWHRSCPFGKGERHGCMVALVRNIVTNEPQAIHRTAIDASGRKLSHLGSNGRLSFGPVGGGAVKLSAGDAVTAVIAIGEGIETALSIRRLPMLDNMPVWSVLSAGGIAAFPVLPGIESVWIAADNDASGTGQQAARTAGERLDAAGVESIIIAPTTAGADLNDRVAHHA